MKIDGRPYRTIWLDADGWSVEIIDQTKLPFALRDGRCGRSMTRRRRSRPCRCAARR